MFCPKWCFPGVQDVSNAESLAPERQERGEKSSEELEGDLKSMKAR